jgi:AcrR family transcriptional regulator
MVSVRSDRVLKTRARTGGYAPGQARIAQILDVALNILIESGYRAVTVREIARRCNVRSGAVSYYYKTKDELMQDLLFRVLDHYEDQFNKVAEDSSLSYEDRFCGILALILDDITSKQTTRIFPELWALANHDPFVDRMVDDMYKRAREALNIIIGHLNPALPDAERETVTLFVSAALEGTTMFAGYQKPWTERMPWVIAIACKSLLDMVKSVTVDDIRRDPSRFLRHRVPPIVGTSEVA